MTKLAATTIEFPDGWEVPDFRIDLWRGRQHRQCVVIPIINEGARIQNLLARMTALGIAAQADILLIDGGSTDGSLSADVLQAHEVSALLVKTGPGKLSAQLRCAYAFALEQGYEGIVTIDGNDKDDPEAIPRFLTALDVGVDFVQASRFVAGGVAENTPLLRDLGIRLVHAPLTNLAAGFHWTDTTQGFRGYSRAMLLDPRVAPFREVFSSYEMLAYLSCRVPRLGFRCLELATTRRYPQGEVPTKISSIQGNYAVLETLFNACLGRFNPRTTSFMPALGNGTDERTQLFRAERIAEVNPREKWFVFFVILVIPYLSLSGLQTTSVLTDPFHQGEFFAAASSLYSQSSGVVPPLTIHGFLDIGPALLMRLIFGSDFNFLPTLVIYEYLNFITAVLFLFLVYALCKNRDNRITLVAGTALIAPILVGYRDLLLIISLLLFHSVYARTVNLQSANAFTLSSVCLAILLGIAIGLGLHWSFDRGLAGLLSVGFMILIMTPRNLIYLIVALTVASTLGVLSLLFEITSLSHYFENIIFLVSTSSQWRYPWDSTTLKLTIFAVIFVATAIFAMTMNGFSERPYFRHSVTSFVFAILATAMLKIGTNRPDFEHIYMALWAPILGVYSISNEPFKSSRRLRTTSSALVASLIGLNFLFFKNYFFILATALLMDACLLNSQVGNRRVSLILVWGLILIGLESNSRHFIQDFSSDRRESSIRALLEPPNNASIVTEGVLWAAQKLREHGATCVFDLSNNGVINGLSQLPSCSPITYPVYANSSYEQVLINNLKSESPAAIVYSSTVWSYIIDGRDMKQRLPKLDKYIRDIYKEEECEYGYCIRFLAR